MRRLRILSLILFIPVYSVFAQNLQDVLTSGMANLQMKRYREAVADFSRYLETDSGNLSANLGRAEAFFKLTEWKNAISDFENAELISPGIGSLGLARTYAQMGDAALSVQYLEKHLKSEKRAPEKKILLDKAFEPIENSGEWRALWRKDWYSDSEQIIREVEYLIGNESFKEALSMLDDQIRQDPENAAYYHLRARIYTVRHEYKQALTNCDLALRYQNDNLEYLVTKSAVLVDMRKYEDALKAMNRAIYLNPVQLHLYCERAEIHNKAGNFTGALKDINHYLKFIDNDQEALFLCGQINQNMGKLYPALESFNKLIELDQGNPAYFFARGIAYLESGTFQYAIVDFGMVLDLDPSNSEAYLNRGKAYLAIDDNEHACYDFDKAREKGNKEAYDLMYKHCR